MKNKYYVTTWDVEKQKFTPQPGVRTGPYTLFGLRAVLRQLKSMGYDIKRNFAPSVLVEKYLGPKTKKKLKKIS